MNAAFIAQAAQAATFTRNSVATKLDGSQVAANVPRFEAGRSGLAIMVEEGTTNLLCHSNQFNDAYWTKMNIAISPNSIQAPDGSISGSTVTRTTTGGNCYLSNAAAVMTAGVATFSVYAKIGNYNQLTMAEAYYVGNQCVFDLAAGTVISGVGQIISIGGGWFRCSMQGTFSAGQVNGEFSISIQGAAGKYIYVWGAQLEQKTYITSYLPTTSVPVIRSTESLSIQGATLSSQSGAVGCWAAAAAKTGALQMPFNAWPFFYVSMANDGRQILEWLDSVGVDRGVSSTGTIDPTLWHYWTVVWVSNQMWLYVDGQFACTSGITTFSPVPSMFDIGSTQNLFYPWNGFIADLRIYSRALTDAEIAAIYQGAA